MTLQHNATLTTRNAKPQNGRRQADKGLGIGAALLGIVCVGGVFAILALLFTAG